MNITHLHTRRFEPQNCRDQTDSSVVACDGPLAQRGKLSNGNRSGDYSKSPRCGAKTRGGTPCGAPAMKNRRGVHTRCRLHGGASTGPKTPEGLQRSQRARWKHGWYSAAAKAAKRLERDRRGWTETFLANVESLDNLFSILEEICRQVDANQAAGLRELCATALPLWHSHMGVLARAEILGEPRLRKLQRADLIGATVLRALGAGADGATTSGLRTILSRVDASGD